MLLKKTFDLLFLSRPMILVPVVAFSLLGYYRAIWYNERINTYFDVSPSLWLVILKISVFSLSVGAVNILNQIEDVAADELNDGFSIYAKTGFSKVTAYLTAFIFFLVSFIIPVFMGWGQLSLFSFAAITTGIFYSFKPIYFTGKPFVDFISNAFGFGIIAFGAGWHLAGGTIDGFLEFSSLYFFLMAAGSISSTLPDIKGDKDGEKLTTAVYLGAKKANLLAIMFLLISILGAIVFNDVVVFWSSLLSLPIYIAYAVNNSQIFMEATYKVGGAILMLIVSVLYPFFIFIGVTVFILTLLYFKFRFNVSYPSLLPINEEHEN